MLDISNKVNIRDLLTYDVANGCDPSGTYEDISYKDQMDYYRYLNLTAVEIDLAVVYVTEELSDAIAKEKQKKVDKTKEEENIVTPNWNW